MNQNNNQNENINSETSEDLSKVLPSDGFDFANKDNTQEPTAQESETQEPETQEPTLAELKEVMTEVIDEAASEDSQEQDLEEKTENLLEQSQSLQETVEHAAELVKETIDRERMEEISHSEMTNQDAPQEQAQEETDENHIAATSNNDQETKTNTISFADLFQETKNDSLRRLKARIEAILFLSDKPRTADSIADQANADVDDTRQALSQLVQDYEDRDGGIMIDCTNGYCMQIADQFEDLTEDILPIELRTAVLRTLSTIALKEPILQSDLMKIRGGGIYEHVKELSAMGLVKKTKEGNSHILHTTKFFTENFKLSQNGLELKTVLQKATPGEVEFIKPNTLIPGNEYEDENTENNSSSESEEVAESPAL